MPNIPEFSVDSVRDIVDNVNADEIIQDLTRFPSSAAARVSTLWQNRNDNNNNGQNSRSYFFNGGSSDHSNNSNNNYEVDGIIHHHRAGLAMGTAAAAASSSAVFYGSGSLGTELMRMLRISTDFPPIAAAAAAAAVVVPAASIAAYAAGRTVSRSVSGFKEESDRNSNDQTTLQRSRGFLTSALASPGTPFSSRPSSSYDNDNNNNTNPSGVKVPFWNSASEEERPKSFFEMASEALPESVGQYAQQAKEKLNDLEWRKAIDALPDVISVDTISGYVGQVREKLDDLEWGKVVDSLPENVSPETLAALAERAKEKISSFDLQEFLDSIDVAKLKESWSSSDGKLAPSSSSSSSSSRASDKTVKKGQSMMSNDEEREWWLSSWPAADGLPFISRSSSSSSNSSSKSSSSSSATAVAKKKSTSSPAPVVAPKKPKTVALAPADQASMDRAIRRWWIFSWPMANGMERSFAKHTSSRNVDVDNGSGGGGNVNSANKKGSPRSLFNLSESSHSLEGSFFSSPISHGVAIVMIGTAAFILSGGRFSKLAPSDLFRKGAFARVSFNVKNVMEVGGEASYAGSEVRRDIVLAGKKYGCHHCGTKKSEQYIADHIPPVKFAKETPSDQRLWPQCSTCSSKQSVAVRNGTRTLVSHHAAVRPFKWVPGVPIGLLAFLESGVTGDDVLCAIAAMPL